MLSFNDWYADLRVAFPLVFGDQTDVPESGDWWGASYLVLWGSSAAGRSGRLIMILGRRSRLWAPALREARHGP
jgi:hypothetical protein